MYLERSLFKMTELQMEYVLKVSETLNFSRAADELHVTQPTVSFQVSNLEKELGIMIFDRSRKFGLSVTPAGRIIIDSIRHLNSDFQKAVEEARVLNSEKPLSARIGIVSVWDSSELMNMVLKECQSRYPHSSFRFESYGFREMNEKIHKGDLDGILTLQMAMDGFDGLNVRKVGLTKAVLLYSAAYPLPDPEHPRLEDFKNKRYFILPQKEAPITSTIQYSYKLSHILNPKVEMLPNFSTMLDYVSCNLGYAVFDSWTRYLKFPDLRSFSFGPTLSVILASKTENKNPLLDLFFDVTQEYASKSGKLFPNI